MKQLFHSRLLDMRLVIANSALRASLAIYPLQRGEEQNREEGEIAQKKLEGERNRGKK